MRYCEICFVDLDKEDHKNFCPKKKPELPKEFKEIFGDLKNKPKD